MQSAIHCKVHNQDCIRRFTLSELTYACLVKQVQQLFGLEDSIVLMYKDNQDDFVTISSDSELLLAISLMSTWNIMSGNALQLFLSQHVTSIVAFEANQPTDSFDFRQHDLDDNFHRHHRGHKNKRGKKDHHYRPQRSRCGGKREVCLERKRERIAKKIETLKAVSLENPQNKRTLEQIDFLQSKLSRVSEELSLLPASDSTSPGDGAPMVVDPSLASAVSLLSLEGPKNDNHDNHDNDEEIKKQIFELKEKIHQLKDNVHEARQKLREARVASEEGLDLAWEAFRAKQSELWAEVDKLHDLKGKRKRGHAKRGRNHGDSAAFCERHGASGHYKHGHNDGDCSAFCEKHGARGHHKRGRHHDKKKASSC